ncbi:MAG TPA: GGDEF domain-containing protein, partial [Geopsychrobacteraceae bacterium]|nr:GGDEF domain-containing protein [Geopsychrobacteraceae bacterium]
MIRSFTKSYERLLLGLFALGPMLGIVYLERFQNSALRFESHAIHEMAIGVAILQGGLVATVTWRCYKASGETFLYWLALGFLGFTLVYLPHGVFTRFAHHNIWFFLLYGPMSRIVMCGLLFCGLLTYGRPSESQEQRKGGKALLVWTAIFLTIDLIVGILAWSPIAGNPLVRMILEGGALALAIAGIVLLLARRIQSPLMTIYAMSLAIFAQSSVSFFYGRPWNHQWWLAHLIFAAGFLLLSFGVVRAFHTTRAFSAVYSQEEMMQQLTQAKKQTEIALQQVQHANHELQRLAATDPLTGAANRRHFEERIQAEISRTQRQDLALSVLAMDLDHFKSINDRYGHHAGDEVLKAFVTGIRGGLRPVDLVGRFGGEEFMVLLPGP